MKKFLGWSIVLLLIGGAVDFFWQGGGDFKTYMGVWQDRFASLMSRRIDDRQVSDTADQASVRPAVQPQKERRLVYRVIFSGMPDYELAAHMRAYRVNVTHDKRAGIVYLETYSWRRANRILRNVEESGALASGVSAAMIQTYK